MKIRTILTAFFTLLLFAACTKEEAPQQIELLLEPLGGNAKLVANTESTAVWSDGDIIRINGNLATITREADGRAYIPPTGVATNRALFPASLATSGPTSDDITVTLPAVYQYAIENNRQKIDLPLAASATGNDPLRFRHLTGGLYFTIENSTGQELTVDRVTVTSNRYRLNGEFGIDLADLTKVAPIPTDVAEERTVTLYFDHTPLTIPNGGSCSVLIPVAPVGEGNLFTVTVATHYQGTRYQYSKTQNNSGTLARNELGYVPVSIGSDASSTQTDNLFEGSGTQNDPFLISSVSDFMLMVQAINSSWTTSTLEYYKNFHYRLTADLDLTGQTINPIQLGSGMSFTSEDVHSLKGLTIQSVGGECSLFQTADGCTVRNITLKDLTLNHNGSITERYLGGFFGNANGLTINNCHVDGLTLNVTGNVSIAYIGGLVAKTENNNTFTECSVNLSSTLNLTATIHYGGLLGFCQKNGNNTPQLTITNCHSTLANDITTTGTLNYGGLVGRITSAATSISSSTYVGNDILRAGSSSKCGGLIGWYVAGSANPANSISGCSISGTISANSNFTISSEPKCFGANNGNFSPLDCTDNLTFTRIE